MKPASIIFRTVVITICISFSFISNSQNNANYKSKNKPQPLPHDLEIQLALSALPPHLRDSASVFVLNPNKGFEIERKGTNGFSCFVARTGDDAMRGNWSLKQYREDILYPISFDQAGVNAQMKLFFDIAEMQAKGMEPDKLKKLIQERYRTHYYKPPTKAGISYMLSPILRTYINPDEMDSVLTANNPHIMYYTPNLSNRDLGGTTPSFRSAYPFIILEGPHGYSIQAVGTEERAAINKEYEGMLTRLCELNPKWCMSKSALDGPAPMHHHY
jgi:hypothetical protein